MNPKIESGIPLPKRRRCHPQRDWSFLRKLKIGESFKVETPNERIMALGLRRHYGIRMTSQKLNGDGFRVWRIA